VAARSIADEGGQYLGFVVVGMAVMQLASASMREPSAAISGGIASGTLEALLATPTSLPTLLIGMVGHGVLWGIAKCLLLIGALVAVGGAVALGALPFALLVLGLVILAHLSVGVVAGAMVLAFRTAGPLVAGATILSALLGGVYYSTTVVPEAVRPLASILPLTHGLRAIRRTLLEGLPPSAVAADVAALAGLTLVLLAGSLILFAWSLRYAQRAGSLAQY
jgi:ABC-2 type transport system permease protein